MFSANSHILKLDLRDIVSKTDTQVVYASDTLERGCDDSCNLESRAWKNIAIYNV